MNAHQMFHLMVTEYFPYLKNNGRHCELYLKKKKIRANRIFVL